MTTLLITHVSYTIINSKYNKQSDISTNIELRIYEQKTQTENMLPNRTKPNYKPVLQGKIFQEK